LTRDRFRQACAFALMQAPTHIHVKGAREHNLKNLELRIPRGKLVVLTGPSGSGKSSLAFDTIYAEGYRKYIESLSASARAVIARVTDHRPNSLRDGCPVGRGPSGQWNLLSDIAMGRSLIDAIRTAISPASSKSQFSLP
jgi:ABC-type arginine transport system ATPase subunit